MIAFDSITPQPVDGKLVPGTEYDITFTAINNSGGVCTGWTNCFLLSLTGGNFTSPISIDDAHYYSETDSYFTLSNSANVWADGISPDSAKFGGASLPGAGIPDGIIIPSLFHFTLTPGEDTKGETFTLDTGMTLPGSHTIWTIDGMGINPIWSGPHSWDIWEAPEVSVSNNSLTLKDYEIDTIQVSASSIIDEIKLVGAPDFVSYHSVDTYNGYIEVDPEYQNIGSYSFLVVAENQVYSDTEAVAVTVTYDPCCIGSIRGNVDGDIEDKVNVVDLTYLVSYLFSGGSVPPCWDEGNVDGDDQNKINVIDLTYFVAYVFGGGPPPRYCPVECPETVTDIDGNVYSTILIGGQCWMAENLKVTQYRDGTPIPHIVDDSDWAEALGGAYCMYDHDPANEDTYGLLYNWESVDDSRGLAPEGWHVATDEDWQQLEMDLGMTPGEAQAVLWRGTDEGGQLKEIGTDHWNAPNTAATNETGFTALGAGKRSAIGGFTDLGNSCFLWTSSASSGSNGWYRLLQYDQGGIRRYNADKRSGFAIRCVKD